MVCVESSWRQEQGFARVSGSPLFGSALLLRLPSAWEFIELCSRGLQYVTENLLGKGPGTPAQAQTLNSGTCNEIQVW